MPQAVQLCHDLLLWLIPHLDKFPRTRRFTLRDRLEILRHLWRLALELKLISVKSYEHGAKLSPRSHAGAWEPEIIKYYEKINLTIAPFFSCSMIKVTTK